MARAVDGGGIGPGGIPLQVGEQVRWVGGYRSTVDPEVPATVGPRRFPPAEPRGRRIRIGPLGIVLAGIAFLLLFGPSMAGWDRPLVPPALAGAIVLAGIAGVAFEAERQGHLDLFGVRGLPPSSRRPSDGGPAGPAVHRMATYAITDRRVVAVDAGGTVELPLSTTTARVVHRSSFGGSVVFEESGGSGRRVVLLDQPHGEIARIEDAVRRARPSTDLRSGPGAADRHPPSAGAGG